MLDAPQINVYNTGNMSHLLLPYYHQETDFSCGPACVQMVLEFFGVKKREEELRQQMNARPRIGTSHQSLIRALRTHGLICRARSDASLRDLDSALGKDHPAIINFIDPSTNEGHYAVMTATTKTAIITHDPWNGPNTTYERKSFVQRWHNSTSRSQQWMLEVWNA